MSGKLVILSGPSGVGKDTVLQRWTEINPDVVKVVSCTTRAPRPGEVDGVDYHFLNAEAFHAKARSGQFLEYKMVHQNWYATPLDHMEALLANGKIAVLKIDVQGALTALRLRSDALSIFLLPPSWEELERRIRGRASDSPEEIEVRLQNARDEIATAAEYAYRVVNDDLERAVSEIDAIVRREMAEP
ncbi:MAG: guanylate kinase [Fimbriimonadaceae bacterium]